MDDEKRTERIAVRVPESLRRRIAEIARGDDRKVASWSYLAIRRAAEVGQSRDGGAVSEPAWRDPAHQGPAQTVYLVIRQDPVTDNSTTVHRSRAGADDAVEAFKAKWGSEVTWCEPGCRAPAVRYVEMIEGGGETNVMIEEAELQP